MAEDGLYLCQKSTKNKFLNTLFFNDNHASGNSCFISDPLTKVICETHQSAIKVGFLKDWIEFCAVGFNGDIDISGDEDHIGGWAGSMVLTLPEGAMPDLNISAGASYLPNIADSDGLEGETPGTLRDPIGGFSAFFRVAFRDKFFFDAESVGATDEFAAGELSFDGRNPSGPAAWNIEIAYAFAQGLALAAKYEGSDDLGDFQPESQFGVALNYSLFESTSLIIEYLRGAYENDDKRDLLTTQIAIEY